MKPLIVALVLPTALVVSFVAGVVCERDRTAAIAESLASSKATEHMWRENYLYCKDEMDRHEEEALASSVQVAVLCQTASTR
jgi:hypothetical protein